MRTINDNQMIYCSWGMECDEQNLLSFWTLFCTLTSTVTTWKIKILKKMEKKTLEDIIILHMCNIHENHMTYGSWYMEYNRHNFLLFWTILCPFIPLTTQKIKIFKKRKKPWRYDTIILHKCLIIDRSFCHLGPFFAHLPP